MSLPPLVHGYLAFMDHSITEQLTNDPRAWHTTAIALSEAGEVSDLVSVIASSIDPNQRRLRKWSAGRVRAVRRYRDAFVRELTRHLPGSSVRILANSATEAGIIAGREHVFRELGIDKITQVSDRSGQHRLRIGPYVDRRTGGTHDFEFPLNRAVMLAWIAHFVLRMHAMLRTEQQGRADAPPVFDGFFYHDKFAGDSSNGALSGEFFQALVSGKTTGGFVRAAFFDESDNEGADLFADNLAGLLNESCRDPERYPSLQSLINSGHVHYEWIPAAA